MRGSDAGKTLGLGFDHGAEVVSAQGTLLLEIGSDGRQVVVGRGFAQKEELTGSEPLTEKVWSG